MALMIIFVKKNCGFRWYGKKTFKNSNIDIQKKHHQKLTFFFIVSFISIGFFAVVVLTWTYENFVYVVFVEYSYFVTLLLSKNKTIKYEILNSKSFIDSHLKITFVPT